MKGIKSLYVGAWAVLILIAGCVSVKYSGKEFPATDSVKVFSEDTKQIRQDYEPIGKAVVTAPEDTDGSDIMSALKAKAEKVGADALLIVSFSRTDVLPEEKPDYSYTEGPFLHWDDHYLPPPYGNEVEWNASDAVKYEYKTVLRAVFLRKKKDPEKDVGNSI